MLAKAFTEITGIKVKHDLIQEGDVVEKLQTQMQSGKNIYDAWINDSDLIGTHCRYQQASPLTDWMAGEGKDVTIPTLDVDDFIGKSFTTAPGRQALPAARPAVRQPLLVPLRLVHRPDEQGRVQGQVRLRPRRAGQLVGLRGHRRVLHQGRQARSTASKVYGHMDYGKKDPSLGWRFTDAWLSMAGNGDKGIPNGLPVDEWGIRMEGCRPVGSSRRARRRHQRPRRRLLDHQVPASG